MSSCGGRLAGGASIYDEQGLLCDRKIITLATLIGNRYPELGRELGMSEEQMMHIKMIAPDNLQHQVYNMLVAWRARDGQAADMNTLNNALKRLGWISVYTQIPNTPDNFYPVI
ncbi:death domain-containing protein CRADD-like [Ptychodera flava]|uniref:death domain-containing protein CRADD-like n=1 Tax=Ptychodera flava TaxID=63121 RepID=UPI00396A2555